MPAPGMVGYVRQQLAAPQALPPPPNPMLDYVRQQTAQTASPGGGARVPPDSMTDAPVYLDAPDTGNETSAHPQSDKYDSSDALFAQKDRLFQQMDAVHKQMDSLPIGSPLRKQMFDQWMALINQADQLSAQFEAGPIGQWGKRQDDIQNNKGADADVMQRAIEDRQNQQRQPLPPPAPGGVPAGTPVVPVTRAWMS